MRVVITGGSGLIGRALAASLARGAHQPVVVSRRPEETLQGLEPGIESAAWDGRQAEGLAPILEGADAIVHLAGESIASGRWSEKRKRRIRDSRVQGTSAVVKALETASSRPTALLQASAVGYYGAQKDEEIAEEHPAGQDFLASVCRDWEAAGSAAESLGVRHLALRTGVVLSATGGALSRIVLPFKFFAGGPVAGGRQWFPWIHIADHVEAVRFLLENEALSGPFNLTTPQPVTNRELGDILGRILNRPSFLPTPAAALKIVLGEMATIVIDGQRAVPGRLTAAGYDFRFPRLEDALRDLLR